MPTLGTKRVARRANAGLANKVRKLERSVQQNKAELKFITGRIPSSNPDTLQSTELTELILQGVGKDERVGDTINIKRVEARISSSDGVARYRLTLYSPVDAGSTLRGGSPPGGDFAEYFDTNQFKIWSDSLPTARMDDVDGSTIEPGELNTVRKIFSIPMKVKYRNGANEAYHNQVILRLVQSTATGAVDLPQGTSGIQYKVWYYDA